MTRDGSQQLKRGGLGEQDTYFFSMAYAERIVVRVNDRGPHRRFVRQGRIIDLSKKAFSDIAPLGQGLIPIQLELL